jgi:molecular chaperone Hsp33
MSATGIAEVRVGFVRHRNALLARGDLAPLLNDQAAHASAHALALPAAHESILRRALAAFTLHCAARPRPEHIAWSINLQDPLLNVFVTADNADGAITGRVFSEGVRQGPENLFFAEVRRAGMQPRKSVIAFAGPDIVEAAEAFYAQSEQMPVRLFQEGATHFTLLAAHPDCDLAWFEAVDARGVAALEAEEHIQPLETRRYRWECGCSLARIVGILRSAAAQDADGLFGDDPAVTVQCPRCGAGHRVTRDVFEAG